MGPESKIEQSLRTAIEGIGGLCWKFISPGHAGVPDRIVIFEGQIYFVELKTQYGQLSQRQKFIHQLLHRNGAKVRVIRNDTDITNFIKEILCL